MDPTPVPGACRPVLCGTEPTYSGDMPGMSAFMLEGGVVYHTYSTYARSTYARGLDGDWVMYQWLDRAPKGRSETAVWWRRHDGGREISRRMVSERASQRAFFGVAALLFAASAAVTFAFRDRTAAVKPLFVIHHIEFRGPTFLPAAASRATGVAALRSLGASRRITLAG
jgi:uncharacterized protein DUF899